MVLHRPVELTAVTGDLPQMSGYATNRPVGAVSEGRIDIMRSRIILVMSSRTSTATGARCQCPCYRAMGKLIHCVQCCDQPGWLESTDTEVGAETNLLDKAIESHFTLLSIPRKESER